MRNKNKLACFRMGLNILIRIIEINLSENAQQVW